MSNNKRPILITGSHRSGSTWVGHMLEKSFSVGYIHEPFSLWNKMGVQGYKFATFDYWYTHVTKDNDEKYFKGLRKTMAFHYDIFKAIKAVKDPKDFVWSLIEGMKFFVHRMKKSRPLIKDPIAFFSAEWLAKTFDMQVVVLVRHPAAFVTSLIKKKWVFDFTNFTRQPLLMENYLRPFKDEIAKYSKHPQPILDQAILLWKIIHYVMLEYKKNHKDWIFLRHEDISRDPISQFRELYNNLGLIYTEAIQNHVAQYSGLR